MSDSEPRFAALKRSSVNPAAIAALEAWVREARDEALHRINIFDFAAAQRLPENDALDLFLHATRLGMFDLSWNMLCPGCGGVLESGDSLKTVNCAQYNCSLCAAAYETTLDELVEVSFTVSPTMRRIAAHEPAALPLWQYYRQMYFSNCLMMPTGAAWDEIAGELTLEREEIKPGERFTLATTLPPQFLILFEPVTHAAVFLDVKGEAVKERRDLSFIFAAGNPPGGRIEIAPGPVRITLENKTAGRLLPALFVANDRLHDMFARRAFLTGKRLLTHQTFRDLFRADALGADQRLKVTSLTILFTDLKGSTALYERVGDLAAYELVQAHFSVLMEVVKLAGGAVVKTIGDAVMASFPTPAQGLDAALRMRRQMDELNAGRQHEDLIVKIGLHEGPCLAVVSNERLDYFGQAVNIAARVQGLAQERAIFLTEPVLRAAGSAALLEAARLTPVPRRALLRGIKDELTVYEIP
jgi:class 3 adenylate cyclase